MRLYTSELVKKYKARTVVNHVSIDVNQGEIAHWMPKRVTKRFWPMKNGCYVQYP